MFPCLYRYPHYECATARGQFFQNVCNERNKDMARRFAKGQRHFSWRSGTNPNPTQDFCSANRVNDSGLRHELRDVRLQQNDEVWATEDQEMEHYFPGAC